MGLYDLSGTGLVSLRGHLRDVALRAENRGEGFGLEVEREVKRGVVEVVGGPNASEGEDSGEEDEEKGDVGEEGAFARLMVSAYPISPAQDLLGRATW